MADSIDLFIYYLRRHLELLDAEIAIVSEKIEGSNDPKGDGYFDTGEYFMGAGFVAVQKYMTETFCFNDVEQEQALNAGPKLAGDVSFAWVVWSAANYWKHDAEWWKGSIDVDAPESDGMSRINISWPASGKSKSNVAHLKIFGRFGHDYICSNVLAALVGEAEGISLQSLLPYLKVWRDNVQKMGRYGL